jgi:hypothetical protein
MRKTVARALSILAFTTLPAMSEASPVFIVGNALGCFGVGCTPTEDASYLGGLLEYNSSALIADFFGTTDPIAGTLAINTITGDFGRFDLEDSASPTWVSTPFSLLLQFAAPTATDAAFSAQIFGVVSTNFSGGVNVVFNPFTLSVPFSSGPESGVLDVWVFNTAVPSGGSGSINGFIRATTSSTTVVPEPATTLLFGLGALAVASMRGRKRHAV